MSDPQPQESSTTASGAEAAGHPTPPAKPKSNMMLLLIIIVLVLGIAGGGAYYYFVLNKEQEEEEEAEEGAGEHKEGDKSEHHSKKTAHKKKKKKKKSEKEYFYKLPTLVVNLNDTDDPHFLKCTIALSLSKGGMEEEIEKMAPKIQHAIILYLSSLSVKDLQGRDNKIKIAEALQEQVASAFEEEELLENIYLSEFVVQ